MLFTLIYLLDFLMFYAVTVISRFVLDYCHMSLSFPIDSS